MSDVEFDDLRQRGNLFRGAVVKPMARVNFKSKARSQLRAGD